MDSHVIEILKTARNLYAAAPSHASMEESVPAESQCVVTAISEASYRFPWNDEDAAEAKFLSVIDGSNSLVEFNANNSTEEVLAAFDRAIAAEEG